MILTKMNWSPLWFWFGANLGTPLPGSFILFPCEVPAGILIETSPSIVFIVYLQPKTAFTTDKLNSVYMSYPSLLK